jgi:glycosyltransferase involved in cell wall biosynthesis
MSKHKVIFVMSSMDNGGAERALLNLLEELPEDRYDINLLLLNPTGLFMGQIPEKVNVLQVNETVRDCFTSIRGRKASAWRVAADVISMIVSRDEETRRGFRWKHFFSPVIDKIPGHYDTAVSFINGQVLYFVNEKVVADRKIVFYHGDYRSAHYSEKYERPCLEHMDGIYAVSNKCIDIVRSVFPEMAFKMKSLPNIVSSEAIRRRASEFVPPEYDAGALRILTVARITHEKGVDTAIRAAAELKQRGCPFHWYEMGKGLPGDNEQAACEKLVDELGVEDVFTFLGARENPYPYIANCDIVVQPSRFEGKSVALDEAKILKRPIVATAYPTVHDQLGDHEGVIAGADSMSLADAIQELIENPALRAAFSARLSSCDYGNADCTADYIRALEGEL